MNTSLAGLKFGLKLEIKQITARKMYVEEVVDTLLKSRG